LKRRHVATVSWIVACESSNPEYDRTKEDPPGTVDMHTECSPGIRLFEVVRIVGRAERAILLILW